ncbi:hypothetical protein [Caballeronia cordobensis]|uniref:hypothetical protein n=1 Tax=Caballeronia cordobensis TaxID=1353886 RepID=UPI0005EDF04A
MPLNQQPMKTRITPRAMRRSAATIKKKIDQMGDELNVSTTESGKDQPCKSDARGRIPRAATLMGSSTD